MSKVFQSIHNALLMPLQGDITAFTSGVFDQEGRFVPHSMLDRCATPARPEPPTRFLQGYHIFGGYLFGHYGHLILDSLSRAYAIRQCRPDLPILFMTTRKTVDARTRNIFTSLSIPNEITLIHEPTQVENLLFSLPGSGIAPPRITPEQVEALARLSFAPSGEKIWLSRSYLSLLGGITNEAEIEGRIAALGYRIIHPERLAFLEQVRLLASSAVVAGFEGSAFYTCLFATRVHGKFLILNRRPAFPEEMSPILTAKKVPHQMFSFPLEHVSGGGPRERSCLTDVDGLLRALS